MRADENALWSLGAHDVSVILHLVGEDPVTVPLLGMINSSPTCAPG